MRRLINLDYKKDKFVLFTIILFIIYLFVVYIPEYSIGRRIKAILVYGLFLFSIVISITGIINMVNNRRINYLKLLFLYIPFIHIIILIFRNLSH